MFLAVLPEGAAQPGMLIHVAEDGLRTLGCSRLRPQRLWGDQGVLRWLSMREDNDLLEAFALKGDQLLLHTQRGLLVTPVGMEAAIAERLTRDPEEDLGDVDREALNGDAPQHVALSANGYFGA